MIGGKSAHIGIRKGSHLHSSNFDLKIIANDLILLIS